MVRNAIDHGIESAAVRQSRGKPEEGRLRMTACHEGGKVIIEIIDDGGGIDVARVREKALNAKLVTPDVLARLSPQEVLRLVFLPGFSTTDQVTQFSGRGVGMDVVRTNIEKIGGAVDIESTPGQGTTIRTQIPLTLAIIPALIVVSGDERYAIPQVSLLELLRLDPDPAQRGVEYIHGAPVYRLRGELLPLVFLNEQLGLEALAAPDLGLNVVVLQTDDRPFGLVIDASRDTEEIVVKPLQQQLKGIGVFAGAAIMGDGRVALVLDVLGLAQRAGVISGAKSRTLVETEGPPQPAAAEAEPVLLFAPRGGGQMASPLSQVARLEKFSRESIELLGSRPVVQYRGEILPLIDISPELHQLQRGGSLDQPSPWQYPATDSEAIPVIVYAEGDLRAGLIVGRILDIVHEPIVARSRANRLGVLCTAVVHEKVTEFVDAAALVRQATNDLLQTAE
jgi:two-component system chemotaxis sensor kinase CheA